MIGRILSTRIEQLCLGARFHAVLANRWRNESEQCFERDDWRCHICGIRIPGFMEVDHLDSHWECKSHSMRTICQFCHNLCHPVWASARGRLRVIWAPGIQQSVLQRIAWAALFARYIQTEETELWEAVRELSRAVDRREALAADVCGDSHCKGFLEALFASRTHLSEKDFILQVEALDAHVRFWPTGAGLPATEIVQPSSGLSAWSSGRFVDVAEEANREFWKCSNALGATREVFESAYEKVQDDPDAVFGSGERD